MQFQYRYRFVLFFLALFTLFAWYMPHPVYASEHESVLPEFSLTDIRGGGVSSASLRGTPLIINTWATWCPFCKNELLDFVKLQTYYGSRLRVIAIDRGESRDVVMAYLNRVGISDAMTFLLDPHDTFYRDIGGIAMPETLFVRADGSIAIHKRGPMSFNEMRDKADALVPTEPRTANEVAKVPQRIGLLFFVAAFIAGLVTFLAPCTLPLVPSYLAFVGGISTDDLRRGNHSARRQVVRNAFAFIAGFSFVFVSMGMLIGLLGETLAPYQSVITRIGGVFVIFFGLLLLGFLNIPLLRKTKSIRIPSFLTIGKPSSSLIVGATFALGWTPCVGPVLGSILALAAVSSTALTGATLLLVFSLGLAVPFIVTAFLFARAGEHIQKIEKYTIWVQRVGGVMLLFIGWLLLTDNFSFLIQQGYNLLQSFDYESTLIQFL